MLDLILYILAAVMFGLAAFRVATPRVEFVALGLLFWVLVPLIAAAGG
jgi:hypothetical protein